MAQPEPGLAQGAVDAQVFSEQAAEYDDRQGRQQDDDAGSLPAGFRAADERDQQKAPRDPGGGDPEDRELKMPRAGERVGEQVRQIDAVERPRFDAL